MYRSRRPVREGKEGAQGSNHEGCYQDPPHNITSVFPSVEQGQQHLLGRDFVRTD